MKKIIYTIVIAALFFGSSSCTDLSEKVYDKILIEDFGKTQAQVNALIAPVYNEFRSVWDEPIFAMQECTSEREMVPTRGGDWWDGGIFAQFHQHNWEGNGHIRSAWNRIFNIISLSNNTLSTVEKNTSMTPESKAQAIAELRGMRALAYYVFCDLFGNGPLVKTFDTQDLPGTSPRSEIFKFVVDELNAVIKDLPLEARPQNYGKFTKGAAYAALAKMYIMAPSWGITDKSEDEYYQLCVNVIDQLIATGQYSLAPNFLDNFDVNAQSCPETIFPLMFNKVDKGQFMFAFTYHYLDREAFGWNRGANNGGCANPESLKKFDPNDPRKAWTFLGGNQDTLKHYLTKEPIMTIQGRYMIHTDEVRDVPGTEKKDYPTWFETWQEDGNRCKKWWPESGITGNHMNNYSFFRLADFLLMKAECLIRLGGSPTGEALSLVNTVRERSWPGKKYDKVDLYTIFEERRFELSWEMIGRQDEIRLEPNGAYFARPRWRKPNTDAADRHLEIFPIPIEAYRTNNKLVQNPGYTPFK